MSHRLSNCMPNVGRIHVICLCVCKLFSILDAIHNITMKSWSHLHCGGFGISVKVVNSNGEQCESKEKDLAAGQELVWSVESGGLPTNCSFMGISINTTVYIRTRYQDSFCPQEVWIATWEKSVYVTNQITNWLSRAPNSDNHQITGKQKL